MGSPGVTNRESSVKVDLHVTCTLKFKFSMTFPVTSSTGVSRFVELLLEFSVSPIFYLLTSSLLQASHSLMSCRCVTPCLDIARIYSEPPEDYNGLSFYFPQSKTLYQ
jgi:hypothetical protein